jgi:flagellar assembly factor FliW
MTQSEITFDEGIIGVPRARRFELLANAESSVHLLRCLDIPDFALPVVDPRRARPDYRPDLGRVFEALGLDDGEPVLVLAVTTIEADGPMANLRAPIVINPSKRLGMQLILDDRSMPLRAPVAAGS